MKKQLLIAALTVMSASAYASMARMTALQNAAHVSDATNVLYKPDQAVLQSNWAHLDFGTASSAAVYTAGAPIASGGFNRKMDGSAWGLYLNNTSTSGNAFRGLGTTAGVTLLNTENPLNFYYATMSGDMSLGAGLMYSKSERKPDAVASQQSQTAMGLYLSAASKDGWDAQFAMGLAGEAKNSAASGEHKLSGKGTMKLSGGYWMDSMYFYGSYTSTGAKMENNTNTTTADRSDTILGLGVVNTHKKEASEFFYGLSYNMTTKKDSAVSPTSLGAGNEKQEITALPMIIGLESDVNSWLALRGAITQNVIMGSDKISTSTGVAQNDVNEANTTVSAGASLKFGAITMDGTLKAAATGNFGSDANFLGQTSFTYVF